MSRILYAGVEKGNAVVRFQTNEGRILQKTTSLVNPDGTSNKEASEMLSDALKVMQNQDNIIETKAPVVSKNDISTDITVEELEEELEDTKASLARSAWMLPVTIGGVAASVSPFVNVAINGGSLSISEKIAGLVAGGICLAGSIYSAKNVSDMTQDIVEINNDINSMEKSR
ncbi:MAG: hypothetical protein IJ565_04740 [Bacilli bacterium]|nr:hypothetical protein [Bacilli bacterium]